jgi:hypothetical protein
MLLQVVVTNHLTTRIGPRNEKSLVPALGESFAHYCNQRIILGHLSEDRYGALIQKSVLQPQVSAEFQVRQF